MTDDEDALEELRAEIERNNPQFDLVTVSRTLCLSKLAAWEKERAEAITQRIEHRQIAGAARQLTALRAAVEKQRAKSQELWGQMARSWNGESRPEDGSMPSWILMAAKLTDALDAALRGGE